MIERVIAGYSTHTLNHPTKHRRYVFRVLADRSVVEVWTDGWCKVRLQQPRNKARRLYAWLKKIGYRAW